MFASHIHMKNSVSRILARLLISLAPWWLAAVQQLVPPVTQAENHLAVVIVTVGSDDVDFIKFIGGKSLVKA